MAYRIEVQMPTVKDGVRVKEWRAVKPSGNQEAPYRFNTMAAAEKTLHLIRGRFTPCPYRIVEVE
jgi:hypothetical protein